MNSLLILSISLCFFNVYGDNFIPYLTIALYRLIRFTYEKNLFIVSAIKSEAVFTHTVNSTKTTLPVPFVFCMRNVIGTGAQSYKP